MDLFGTSCRDVISNVLEKFDATAVFANFCIVYGPVLAPIGDNDKPNSTYVVGYDLFAIARKSSEHMFTYLPISRAKGLTTLHCSAMIFHMYLYVKD